MAPSSEGTKETLDLALNMVTNKILKQEEAYSHV